VDQRLLFHCDTNSVSEDSIDRVQRCLVLAEYLQDRRGAIVTFLVQDCPEVSGRVRAAGFSAHTFTASDDAVAKLEQALNLFRPDVVVFDLLALSKVFLEICQKGNVVAVTLDEFNSVTDTVDIAINAVTEQRPTYYRGPDYIILRDSLVQPPRLSGEGISVLLSPSACEHATLTARILDILQTIPHIERLFVVDPGSALTIRTAGADMADTVIVKDRKSLAGLLHQVDILVTSETLDLFEAMRQGTACVVVTDAFLQREIAERYEQIGAACCVDLHAADFEGQLRDTLTQLATQPERREQMSHSGKRQVDGRGLERVADLVSICTYQEWDTSFFGTKIAYLTPQRLTEPMIQYALQRCRLWNIECLYYLSDCHHAQSVALAEQYGFHFVDIRLTFEYDLVKNGLPNQPSVGDVVMRPHRLGDVPALKKIARTAYLDSRYYFDQRFPEERCEAFYVEWIEKSCYGYVDKVLVAELDGQPVGFITCRVKSPFVGTIELVGVDSKWRGKGLGVAVVEAALQWFADRGIERVTVVTQGRNYAAQRLYQHCGFLTESTQLWYHKWFS
jgi:spore coat polysaccharide biosynthesis predicted glycosyltransferase SpsG/GNAT superfamily N-acetyltransferase